MATMKTASSSQYTTSNVDHMLIEVVSSSKTTSRQVDLEFDATSLCSIRAMPTSVSSVSSSSSLSNHHPLTNGTSDQMSISSSDKLVVSSKLIDDDRSRSSTPTSSASMACTSSSSSSVSFNHRQANRIIFLEMIDKIFQSMLNQTCLTQLYVQPGAAVVNILAPTAKVSTFPLVIDEQARPFVLQPSLFPTIMAPTVYFAIDNDSISNVPSEFRQFLRWKMTLITSNTMRFIVNRSGYKMITMDKGKTKFNNWNAIWCKHLRVHEFGMVGYHQRVNHFPGSFNFGRKDRLWLNLKAKADKYGHDVFGDFHPKTFLLPQEYGLLLDHWKECGDAGTLETASGKLRIELDPSNSVKKQKLFICKPPASARGQGISIVSSLEELQYLMAMVASNGGTKANRSGATSNASSLADDSQTTTATTSSAAARLASSGRKSRQPQLVVQEYIANPCLLSRNSAKFDLRVYVLVTSISPLRIYIHEEGIVRFASAKYSNDSSELSNRFMHLTNYSVNKNSDRYVANQTADGEEGMKWTLTTLWRYLAQHCPHVNIERLWAGIQDMIIKTVISAEAHIVTLSKQHLKNRRSCFELLGFDIMIDDCFKLWLLEVNITPSLRADTVLDFAVKNQLVCDTLNTLGYQLSPRFRRFYNFGPFVAPEKSDPINVMRDEADKEKHQQYETAFAANGLEACTSMLEALTDEDVAHLMDSEDELFRCGRFTRVFPALKTGASYLQYFDAPSYHNLLLAVWEDKYGSNREQGINRLRQYLLNSDCLEEQRTKLKAQSSEIENILRDLKTDSGKTVEVDNQDDIPHAI